VAVEESIANGLLATLSADERERAGRYLFDKHRWRFIVGRAAQRLILAKYIAVSPADIEFTYSPLGKPALAECADAGNLKFNVSNSGDMAVIAITLGTELGVDVERIRDNIDYDGLAHRYFAAEERDKLRQLPEELRLAGFFDCWTRKEAFLKAIGKGLTYPLDRAIVSVGPSEPCRLLSLDGDTAAAAAWSLIPLVPAPGYVAAIALPGAAPNVRTFRWEW
jgi:4'-phosphopantetheinyl transferase